MARRVNQRTVDLVKEFEGYEKQLKDGRCMAYLDTQANSHSWSPGYRGLWTIGWGSTGADITEGTIWTRAYAETRLWAQLDSKAAEVEQYLSYPVNDNQFGALVSLAYNVGTAGIHGILNLVNAGELETAANSFLNYNHSDGVVLAGLTRRRYAEKELFEWETPAEVSQMSPVINYSQMGQKLTAGTMFGGYLSWENLGMVRQFTTDHAGVMLLCAAGSVFLIFKAYETHLFGLFNKGILIPVGTKPVPVIPPEALVDGPVVAPENTPAVVGA